MNRHVFNTTILLVDLALLVMGCICMYQGARLFWRSWVEEIDNDQLRYHAARLLAGGLLAVLLSTAISKAATP